MDMIILTDFPRFPASRRAPDGTRVRGDRFPEHLSGADLLRLLRLLRRVDLILVQNSVKILGLACLFWFLPFLKKPIVAVDLILRTPHTPRQKFIAWFKRLLLKRVDHFVFYFKELKGYQTYYGITPERSSYVPFKSNMQGN